MDSSANVPSWDRWLQRFWYLFFALWALFVSLVITANFHAPAPRQHAPGRHRPIPIATPHPVHRSPAWQPAV